jgi:hypothetical protein
MAQTATQLRTLQSLSEDDFLFFFMQLRKSRVRTVVQSVRTRFPNETPVQHAKRLIDSHTPVSFLGGTLTQFPMLLPGAGLALQLLGFSLSTSMLSRMHIHLILEIALLFGKDIDDQARVPEMMAVVAATGAAAATPLAFQALEIVPVVSVPAAGLAAAATVQLIGNTAIQYYSKESQEHAEATMSA